MKNIDTFIHILPIIKSQMEGLQNIIDERKMFLNNSVSLNTLQLKSIRGIEEGIGRGKIKITDPDTLEYIKSVKAEQIAKAQERQTARTSSSKKQSPHSSKKGGQSKSKTRKSQKKANVW
jgi:dissimilatory sulfite reductase (desulfoviridin) alpha/beta subunit